MGTNTLTKFCFDLRLISLSFSFVANPTAHEPLRGYSTNTTFFLFLSLLVNISNICSNAEYIVLRIGILFKILLNISNNFFPIIDKDSHPINVIKIIEMIISTPGILYGR